MWCQLSTTLLAVITEVAQWGAPSGSRPQSLLTMASETVDPIDRPLPPTPHRAVPPGAPRIARCKCGPQIARLCCSNRGENTRSWVCQANALTVRPLRV